MRFKRQCVGARYYPEYTGDGSAYELLADAYQKKGNKSAAIAELEKYRASGGTGVDHAEKTGRLGAESGNRNRLKRHLRH